MSKIERFNPSRLAFARKRRGLTKSKVASLIDVDLRSVSAYENGEFNPDEERLQRLGKVLRFPVDFFSGDDIEELSPDSASFRAMSKMTAGQRDMALGAGAIALLVNRWIEDRFTLPPANLPDLHLEESPEIAADSLRRYWGLGELPIKNIIHLLESKGVRIFTLSVNAREVDAFSVWRDGTPFVFLNTKKSAEHSRFDTAHELAHLVLHRRGAPQGPLAEREANAFASAFLMPRASVIANAPRFATVDQLIKLKKYWTVSTAALAHRLHTIGIISEWQYRTLCIEISTRGFRTNEPEEAPRETSQIFKKVFKALREDNRSEVEMANDLHIPREEIEQLVFGLTIVGLTGFSSRSSVKRKRSPLYLVDTDKIEK